MKFCFIIACILSINFLYAQEEEEFIYSETIINKNIIEVGMDYMVPYGDFGNKLSQESLGGYFSYLRQLNQSRFFASLAFSTRNIGRYEISERYIDTDQSTKISNLTFTGGLRLYPEFYFSIFEFYFEGGTGINHIAGNSSLYDRIAQESYDHFTEMSNRKIFFYGLAGVHVPVSQSMFLTFNYRSLVGPTIEFMSIRKDITTVENSWNAFDFKKAAYTANAFNLSLSFIF